ncbi:6365_t:CDS:2, partial [Scutellospora calospora]
ITLQLTDEDTIILTKYDEINKSPSDIYTMTTMEYPNITLPEMPKIQFPSLEPIFEKIGFGAAGIIKGGFAAICQSIGALGDAGL